ncbi:tricalbin-1-like isoform X1 [Neodiprion virginianus]|uniref:tricalbin-1-like isoform X1 n=1 Tax=Neodiprion virginianus TaxID=2961670 RepID=UPI001EE6DE02|nr:tricalbin-1-like isoform X1 [Neodiprion virginianus]
MQIFSSFMARHLKRAASLKKGKREGSGSCSPGERPPAVYLAGNPLTTLQIPVGGPAGGLGGVATMSTDDLATQDDEFAVALALAQKTERDAEAVRGALYLGVALLVAWVVGAAGLSLAWLVLVLALVGTIFRARLSRLLQTALQHELSRLRRRRALYKDETAEWLSLLINRWYIKQAQTSYNAKWRFSAGSIFTLAKERLEPILNESKPGILGPLELRELTFGEQTPCITRVRALDYSGDDDGPAARPGFSKLSVEADLRLDCEQFRMLITTRLFGKGVGMDIDVAVEKLSLAGTVLATLTLNSAAPFPHVTHLSVSFVEKPDVWFSVRVLRAVQMMEVPLVKTWIHAVVSDALASWIVDPGHLELDLRAQERPGPGLDCVPHDTPHGVLTVTLSQSNTVSGTTTDEVRWLVVTIGDQRLVTPHLCASWTEDVSFLVGSLENERISIKLKAKRLVSTITLAQFELALGVYNWENSTVVESVLQQKKPSRSSANIPNINARLEYSSLPTLEPDLPQPESLDESLHPSVTRKNSYRKQRAGVLVVYIHSAEDLINSDPCHCNPYCMLFNNRKKVKTTHYVRGTSSPRWEARTQFLVQDYTQVSLSFVICSWNISKMADTDMLGLAMLSLSQGTRWIVRRELTLSGSSGSSTVTVSVLFHPVRSVQQVVSSRRGSIAPIGSDDDPKMKRNSLPWMQQAKMLLIHRDADPASSDISSLLSTGSGLMEVTLLRAKDLVAKDLNGFSDPFCELRLNNETKYKSSIKKKTLNPCWDESSIMGLPRAGENLDIMLWDHDTFGMKDYLGKVSLALEDIRKLSSSDQSHWFILKGTKSGSVELKIKVLSEESETQSTYAASTVSDSSTRQDAEPDAVATVVRRPSMEKSKMRLHLGPVVPPPPPPRTVTLIKPPAIVHLPDKTSATSKESGEVNGLATGWSGRDTSTVSGDNAEDGVDSSTLEKFGERRSSHHSLTPSPDNGFGKKTPQYNSFRVMKQKVKRGLKLRRFRSEVNIEDKGDTAKGVALSLEPRGGGEADATELLQGAGLSHAVSQPDMLGRIRQPSPNLRGTRDLKAINGTREKYSGVEGKVLQAQGLHVAHIAQLYCRVKFQACTSPEKMSSSTNGGKTLTKSRLLPAMPNPQFGVDFQIDSDEVSRQSSLIFEIRSSNKELLASRRVTLHELLSGASAATNDVHTWLALNNGASLEIQIGHGKEVKNKSTKKLFRSWSVHRIGKI